MPSESASQASQKKGVGVLSRLQAIGRSNKQSVMKRDVSKTLSWWSLSALSILMMNKISFTQNLHQDGSISHRLVISPQSSRFLKWSWASHRHGYSKQTPSEMQTRNCPSTVFLMTVSLQEHLISSIIWQETFCYFGWEKFQLCIKWRQIWLIWQWNYWTTFTNGMSRRINQHHRLSGWLLLSDKVSNYHIKSPVLRQGFKSSWAK